MELFSLRRAGVQLRVAASQLTLKQGLLAFWHQIGARKLTLLCFQPQKKNRSIFLGLSRLPILSYSTLRQWRNDAIAHGLWKSRG